MFQATTQAIKWFFIVGTFFLSKSTNGTTWHNKSSKCPCTTFRLGGSQLIEKLLRINWCWKKQEPKKMSKIGEKTLDVSMLKKRLKSMWKALPIMCDHLFNIFRRVCNLIKSNPGGGGFNWALLYFTQKEVFGALFVLRDATLCEKVPLCFWMQ